MKYILLLIPFSLFSQEMSFEKKIENRVKLPADFFYRFNASDTANITSSARKQRIFDLINADSQNVNFIVLSGRFVEKVCNVDSPIFLSYKSQDWLSIAHCTFLYQSIKVKVDIIFQPEITDTDSYSWVIKEVNCLLLANQPQRDKKKFFLGLDESDQKFISLYSIFKNNKAELENYTHEKYSKDQLSIFLFLLKHDHLKYISTDSVEFQIFQIPGWMFSVKKYSPVTNKSGWLISNIEKISSQEKNKYFHRH